MQAAPYRGCRALSVLAWRRPGARGGTCMSRAADPAGACRAWAMRATALALTLTLSFACFQAHAADLVGFPDDEALLLDGDARTDEAPRAYEESSLPSSSGCCCPGEAGEP